MNRKLKKVLSALLIACLPILGTSMPIKAASNDSVSNNATINLSSKEQLIRGFGASSAWCGVLSDTCMDTLYKNAGLNILRVRIEPNEGWNKGDYKAWETELSNAKKAEARGAIVFATPWTPPSSMKTNNSTSGTGGASLKPSCYADYANYLKTYAKYFADNGAPLYAISLQNEPDWPADYDGCAWTADQFHDFLKAYGASISKVTKIIMPESLGFNPALSDPTLNDPTTASYVSIVGGHLYGHPATDYPLARNMGKEIWMTEHYFEGETMSACMPLAKEINDCMTTANMNAYVYWWIGYPGNGLYNTATGVASKRLYVLGQFAKFIHHGYYRVDTTNNPQPNVYVSAYKSKHKIVIVAINQGTSAVNQNFNVQNGKISKVSSWLTSETSNMVKSKIKTKVTNGNFTASLPANSITTFVGNFK